jgi:transcriptional regulator with XRE-family HTH domain
MLDPDANSSKLKLYLEKRRYEDDRKQKLMAREERQRDMGLGYLVWVARRYKRWTQRAVAQEAALSPSMISRFERGNRRPTLDSLQRVATACELEVVIGLRSDIDGIIALGTMFEEGPMTELIMYTDPFINEHLPEAPWREKYGF